MDAIGDHIVDAHSSIRLFFVCCLLVFVYHLVEEKTLNIGLGCSVVNMFVVRETQ